MTKYGFFDKMFKRCMGVTAAYGADNRIYGELSERSKVQHSKCCVRNVPRVRIPNSPPKKRTFVFCAKVLFFNYGY